MNMKKVKLKTDVFKERAEKDGFEQKIINSIIKDLDNKVVETNIDESFIPYGMNERIYNLMGWAINECELEFLC